MSSIQLESLQLNSHSHHQKHDLLNKDHKPQSQLENNSLQQPNPNNNHSLSIMDLHPAAKFIGNSNLKR